MKSNLIISHFTGWCSQILYYDSTLPEEVVRAIDVREWVIAGCPFDTNPQK